MTETALASPPRSSLDLIGATPLVEVTHFDTGPCRLFLKLESQNPGGSIKDRVARTMVAAAERDGLLKPGGTLVEATAGNTGLALTLVAAQRGYKVILVVPDKMSQEKIFAIKALGARVIMTRSDVGKGHPEYYQDMAERLAKEIPGAWYANQFSNPANPLAHETGTGPEIWAQLKGRVDAVVCGVGSGGTLTGLTRFFRQKSPRVKMILADPAGSVLADYVAHGYIKEAGSWLVEGIGEDFVPPICDLSGVREAYTVPDSESFAAARELLKKEGIMAGSSSGTLLAAALRYCRTRTRPEHVVSLVCDHGNRYLSKMYNDYWMSDQGFLPREVRGDLGDLIARRAEEDGLITVAPEDALLTAHGRFKLYDVSQLPVINGDGKIVGIIDESDVLLAVAKDQANFRLPVKKFMTTRLTTLSPSAPISDLLPLFDQGLVPIVMDGDQFLGLVTRIDLLNHLRRKLK